jgi:hypothetical protein
LVDLADARRAATRRAAEKNARSLGTSLIDASKML